MRVLLVDDEELALDRLAMLLRDIEGVELVGTARNGEEALAAIALHQPDLVVLDIQMPGHNGLRVAAELPPESRPEIIFVTAHEHYAPDAFDVDAVDYLLKPVRFDRLRQSIDRAKRRRTLREQAERALMLEQQMSHLQAPAGQPRDEVAFWVPERTGQRRVPLDTIDWIEAARDYVLLHTDLRSHMLRTTMSGLEERLVGSDLLRVHRSAFVRPAKVREVQRSGRSITLILEGGANVQVGPSYLSAIEQALGIA